MRMNLRVAICAASALRTLQLIDLRIYGSPGFQFHRMKSGNLGDGRSSPPIIRTHQRAPLSHVGAFWRVASTSA